MRMGLLYEARRTFIGEKFDIVVGFSRLSLWISPFLSPFKVNIS